MADALSLVSQGVSLIGWLGARVLDPGHAWDLDVFVPGNAVTQGSTRAFAIPGKGGARPRAVVVSDRKPDLATWRSDVVSVAGQAWPPMPGAVGSGPTDLPVVVLVDFVLPRRKSAPKTRTGPHTRKPDLDKLTRAVWDGLTHVVIADDSQVVASAETKREAQPGETPGARIRLSVLR